MYKALSMVNFRRERGMKNFIKFIIFLLLLLAVLSVCTFILNPAGSFNEWNATNTIVDFYKQDKKTIDVMYMGASGVYTGISPFEIYSQSGITGYSLSTPGQKIWSSYYLIRETLKTQMPKIIFLECGEIFNQSKDEQELNKRNVIDSMKLSKNKIQMINDDIYNFSNWQKLGCIFPILRYHGRWDNIDQNDVRKFVCRGENTYKGYLLESKIKKLNGKNKKIKEEKDELNNNFNNIETTDVSDEAKKYINEIKNLCAKYDIKLVLIKIPEPTYWSLEKSASVYKYADEIDTPYIDLNYDENINIDWEKDTQDEGNHLNIYGAEKIGKYIADYLKNNYDLQDHRDSIEYKKWNDELENYQKQKICVKEQGHG